MRKGKAKCLARMTILCQCLRSTALLGKTCFFTSLIGPPASPPSPAVAHLFSTWRHRATMPLQLQTRLPSYLSASRRFLPPRVPISPMGEAVGRTSKARLRMSVVCSWDVPNERLEIDGLRFHTSQGHRRLQRIRCLPLLYGWKSLFGYACPLLAFYNCCENCLKSQPASNAP